MPENDVIEEITVVPDAKRNVGIFLNHECILLIDETLDDMPMWKVNEINKSLAADSSIGYGLLSLEAVSQLRTINVCESIDNFVTNKYENKGDTPLQLKADIYSVEYGPDSFCQEIKNLLNANTQN